MNYPSPTLLRPTDLLRHLKDLRTGTYEGAENREAQVALYQKGIALITPIALAILEEANRLFLQGSGDIQIIGPASEDSGKLETRFELSWPEQRTAHLTRGLHEPLQPVRIIVTYAQNFLHPHLAASTAGYWPFQVTNQADAERQTSILCAIVELELHQRIYETDWRILPVSRPDEEV